MVADVLSLAMQAVAGAALGIACIAALSSMFKGNPVRQLYAANAGLVVAALVYIAFVLLHPPAMRHWFPIELAGVVIYTIFALFSTTLQAGTLAALGWVAHCAWDMGVHSVDWPANGPVPADGSPHVPHWYPGLCAGFDLVFAAWLMLSVTPALSKVLKRSD